MSDYETAVTQLQHPTTWCKGARTLAALGGKRALVPLMQAYECPAETSKLCLLDAMRALGAPAAADDLYDHGTAEERRLALHMMGLFADENHLPRLASSIRSDDPTLRTQACRALTVQVQTPAWEAILSELLDVPDTAVREQVIRCLVRRQTDTARQALQAQAEHESDPALRALLTSPEARDRPILLP